MTAMHLTPCRDCPGAIRRGAALDALTDMTHWAFATVREWRRRSRGRQELAQLNGRMLQDVGLTHADREFLVNKPFWRE